MNVGLRRPRLVAELREQPAGDALELRLVGRRHLLAPASAAVGVRRLGRHRVTGEPLDAGAHRAVLG
jgi:hypothetical protein